MKLAIALVFSCAFSAVAAVPNKIPSPVNKTILAGNAAIAGGVAGTGFSLRDFKLTQVAGKERLIIDIADLTGSPLKGLPGYYHAELQKNPSRLVIDFAQTPNVFIDEKKINERLRSSKVVSRSAVLIDPTDQTLSLILDLKKTAKAQVYQVRGNKGTSRVVVDLM